MAAASTFVRGTPATEYSRRYTEALPTHNRLTTRPTIKQRSFQHSGVFEFNGQEGQWMWSDTGSFVRESPGDIVKVKNPNAYNFAAPTASL